MFLAGVAYAAAVISYFVALIGNNRIYLVEMGNTDSLSSPLRNFYPEGSDMWPLHVLSFRLSNIPFPQSKVLSSPIFL